MKTKLNSTIMIAISLLLLIGTFSSCNQNRGSKNQKEYIEECKPINSMILNVLQSYSSGIIPENQTLKVVFRSDVKLNKQFGEPLPSNLFNISPKLKGECFWIDEHSIGYRLTEKAKRHQKYQVVFDMQPFVDLGNNNKLEFGFAVREQDFDITKVLVESNETSATLTYTLQFANSLLPEQVLSLLDKNFVSKYKCSVEKRETNQYNVSIADIALTDKETEFEIQFNGKQIGIDKTLNDKRELVSEKEFRVIDYDIDKNNKSITVIFTRPLKEYQNLTGFVNVSPNMSFNTTINNNRLTVFFDNNYNNTQNFSKFNINFSKAIQSVSGAKLKSDYNINDIDLNLLAPKIRWTDEGFIIPNDKDAPIYFDAICLNAVIVRIIRVYDNNVVHFLQENNFDETWGMRRVGQLEKKLKLALSTSDYTSWKTFSIVLGDYVDVVPGAMYQISLDFDPSCYPYLCENMPEYVSKMAYDESDYWDDPNTYSYTVYYWQEDEWKHQNDPCHLSYYNYKEINKNIFISDLALTAKTANENQIDVFVRNISDAEPSQAEVTLLNYQLQQIASAKTNSDGYVSIKYTEKPYLIMAQNKRGDKAFLKLQNNLSLSYSKFDISGEIVTDNLNGYVYSNRDVWRPGDTIQLGLMLDDKTQSLPTGYPVVLELTNSEGRSYARRTNNHPVGGIYTFEIATAAGDPTGVWRANLKVGNRTFDKNLRVETVKPNRLQIDFEIPDLIRCSNNRIDLATIKAQWLNGLKASNLSAVVDATIVSKKPDFKGFEHYNFENVTLTQSVSNLPIFSSKLGSDGSKEISLEKLQQAELQSFSTVLFNIKVFESEGEFSTTLRSTQLSPFSRYVGVSLPDTESKYGEYYFVDRDWTFDVAVVDEDGNFAKGNIALNYEVYQLENYWWWSTDEGYSQMRYQNDNLRKKFTQGTLNSINGKASLTLNVPKNQWGCYLLVIKDKKGGSEYAKVVRFDWPEWGQHNTSGSEAPSLLTLETDKKTYQVGETMRISFPANDQAKAIVSIESNSNIIKIFNLNKLQNDNTLDVVITEAMTPNVYVYVSLLQPRNKNNDMPVRLYGLTAVEVRDNNKFLKPQLSLPQQANSKQNITISVSETQGRPMYYTLAIVDEGILSLTQYKTPKPENYFFMKQALNVRTWDNYDDIVDVFTGNLNSVYAIGGGYEAEEAMLLDSKSERNAQEEALRKRLTAVATLLGPFELKAGATATHQYHIPNYLGSLRVMVVACDNKGAFGSAQQNIAVKDPIMILQTAPRIVSPNDVLVLPVQVMAPDLKGKTLNINLETPNLNLLKTPPTTLQLDLNGEATFNLELAVPDVSGLACVNISASNSTYTAHSKVEMPIRLPLSVKHEKIKKTIEPGQDISFNIDTEGIEGTLEGEIIASGLIPIDLFNRLDYLKGYPHGCLEQVSSKAFSQLYLNYFIDLSEADKAEIKNNIEAGISKMTSYLNANGSMNNWVQGNYSNPWSELYALHFLVEAQKQGYKIPDNLINTLTKYQSQRAKSWNFSIDEPSVEITQAYRLFVLSLAGKAETAAMNRFKEHTFNYSLSRILIAAAYAQIGKVNIAQNLLPVIDFQSDKPMSDYMNCFGSRQRDLAFATYVEMLCNSDANLIDEHIEELAKALSSDKWMDTQSTAFSLFVLGQYAQNNNFSGGQISLNGSVNGETFSRSTNKNSIGFNFIPLTGENTFNLSNNGSSPLHININTKAIVTEYDDEEKGQFYNMTVKYFDKDGTEIDPSQLSKGSDLYVEITVSNPSEYWVTDNALSYLLPSGWQFTNNQVFGYDDFNKKNSKHIDLRDDRSYFYFDLAPMQSKTFRLSLNATYEGNFTIPAVTCEDMYNNEIYYIVPSRKITVN